MAEPKFTYGLDENGTLIHVNDVNRGEACNCVCIECGEKLVARQGDNNQWHFSHKNTTNCHGGRMTALHKLAQQIIQEEKKIRTPRYEDSYYKQEPQIITFDEVLVEQHIKTSEIDRRPDCVGVLNGTSLWIEIKVTHEVDEVKQCDIIKENICCMEVDLSDLVEIDYTREQVRMRLFSPSEYRCCRWINNPELLRKSQEERQKSIEKENKQSESSRKIQEYIDAEHKKEAALKRSQKMKEKPQDDFADEYSTPTYDEWIKFCQSFDK